MAKSALYILDSKVKPGGIDKEKLKVIRKLSSKPKRIVTKKVDPVVHNASCLENNVVELDVELLKKVIATFHKRAEGEAKSGTSDLLEDASRDYVFLQISLLKVNTNVQIRPLQIKLTHPIYTGKEVCIFVKDPQKHWKEIIKREKIPEVKKIIGVGKLRKKYAQYEDKRKLCRSFDLFLCDKAVCCSLPSLLGKQFIEKKRMPVPVSLSKNGLVASIRGAIESTYYKLATGNTSSVKIGTCTMNADELVENATKVFKAIKKFHTEDPQFKNVITSVFLNWQGTESLMLYSRGLLENVAGEK